MALKTYYWNANKVSLFRFFKNRLLNPNKKVFRYGNAGDIFNIDLVKYLYNHNPVNVINKGNRLLMVGSILSKIQKGDIISGIGWKGNDLSEKEDCIASAKVYGVRGPLTRSIFENYKTDLSDLKFELDPGLLIKEVYNLDINKNDSKYVVFIPHFKDFWVYNGIYPKGVKVVNIDNNPKVIAKVILNAKIVYSSSLHGIIFSHALNKECVFVQPQSDEPMFKYHDYYLSVGLEMPTPIKNIYSINYFKDKSTMLNKEIGIKDFEFPTYDIIKKNGLII